MLRLIYKDPALRDLRKIPKEFAERILRRVDAFAAGAPADVKKLVGQDEYRMRIGDYRIIFQQEADLISVLRVVHRKDAY
jgi:mRNA interferase RelE/StbE